MTTTLLAVDDSKTMRRVLEITFAGEEYRTIIAEGSADALAKVRNDRPAVALVDANLGDDSGYDLCQKIKSEAPSVSVVLLTSKQQPYDRVRGTSVGADDFMDKPFDTQQLIDKVASLARRGGEAAAHAPAGAAASPAARPAAAAAAGGRPAAPASAPLVAPPPKPAAGPPTAGLKPLSVSTGGQPAASSGGQPRPAAPSAPMVRAPTAATPAAQPTAGARPPSSPKAAPPPAAARVALAASVPLPAGLAAPTAPMGSPAAISPGVAPLAANLESGLIALGLTKDQIQGVLALSKEVVERVVWEVVPPLAEAMVKEEIRRLTSD